MVAFQTSINDDNEGMNINIDDQKEVHEGEVVKENRDELNLDAEIYSFTFY